MSVKCTESKLLLVDSSSIAVGLFFAMDGKRFLTQEQVSYTDLMCFIQDVAQATVDSVQRRVQLDGYTSVRMAMEAPPWADVLRYSLYPDYKHALTVKDKPRVARTLQGPIIDAALAAGIPTMYSPGMEADDVISIMVNKLDEDWVDRNSVAIWSKDRDLHQLLIHDNITMIGKAGEITSRETVEEYWGHFPTAVPLLKALIGDKSDNIPGIDGVGLKTAREMIRPAPYAKPVPYVLDPELISGAKVLEIQQKLPRIQFFARLCKLIPQGPLYNGSTYFEHTTQT